MQSGCKLLPYLPGRPVGVLITFNEAQRRARRLKREKTMTSEENPFTRTVRTAHCQNILHYVHLPYHDIL